jgi:5-methylcytosine-specific restriction endonuclease McrA
MGIIHSRHQWAKLRARFKDHCRRTNARCYLCIARGDYEHAVIDYTAPARTPHAFEADHAAPVGTNPHLAYAWSNLRASHARCNRQKGTNDVVEQHVWVKPDW